MSTWIEGRTYDYYGQPLTCLRRYFDGALELVDLTFYVEAPAEPESFTRAALTLAPCVIPRVTETLGGVLRPDACRHEQSLAGEPARLIANAGPFAGHECCALCGSAIEGARLRRAAALVAGQGAGEDGT